MRGFPRRADNRLAEGFSDEQIHLVGKVMMDTLLANAERVAARGTLAGLGLRPFLRADSGRPGRQT
jgi:UDP-N-acetylglucosamine 2-epimerase (non-hydrolysing)